jgi:hypothetical protein
LFHSRAGGGRGGGPEDSYQFPRHQSNLFITGVNTLSDYFNHKKSMLEDTATSSIDLQKSLAA